jgi:predicted aldo/keto reductase-like oxidoreductase
MNYFDTARAYGDSEEMIGDALKNVIDKCVIATKTHQRTKQAAARAGIGQSLRKLRTDKLDIVQLHGIDSIKRLEKAMGPEGSLSALKEARSEGRIDFVGISGHVPWVLIKAIKTNEFDIVLVPLNILTREASEKLIPLAKELDIGVVVMKPFGGPNYSFVQRDAKTGLDKRFFKKYFGNGMSAIARNSLRFILAHDVSTVVPGFTSVKQVETAVKVGEEFGRLTKEERAGYEIGKIPREPFCRECGLCLPCPGGLNIPFILRLEKYYAQYGVADWSKGQYNRLRKKIDSCTRCGECEPKCPYKLPIPDLLQEAEDDLCSPGS